MDLIFRGTTYNCNATQRPTPHLTQPLTYRGDRYLPANRLPATVPAQPLHYRGTAYHAGQPATATIGSNYGVRQFNASGTTVEQIHQFHLLQNVQRRMAIAQSRGDQHLLHLLQAEQQHLAS